MARAFRWDDRIGGAAGIAFVSLIVASWFVDTTSFDSADQTAQVIARDLANRVDGLETETTLVGLAAVVSPTSLEELSFTGVENGNPRIGRDGSHCPRDSGPSGHSDTWPRGIDPHNH